MAAESGGSGGDLGAHELLWGAKPIAMELFGRADPSAQRKAYHQLEKGYIPGRKVGAIWCVDRLVLRAFLRGEEDA